MTRIGCGSTVSPLHTLCAFPPLGKGGVAFNYVTRCRRGAVFAPVYLHMNRNIVIQSKVPRRCHSRAKRRISVGALRRIYMPNEKGQPKLSFLIIIKDYSASSEANTTSPSSTASAPSSAAFASSRRARMERLILRFSSSIAVTFASTTSPTLRTSAGVAIL